MILSVAPCLLHRQLVLACSGDKTVGDSGSPPPADSGSDSDTTMTAGPLDVTATVASEMPTVITVAWSTEGATEGWVEFGVDGALDRSTRPTASGTAHEAVLVGLPPSTAVSYRVVVGEVATEAAVVSTGDLGEVPEFTVEGDGQDRFLALPHVVDDVSTVLVVNPEGQVVWRHADDRGLSVFRAHVALDGSGIVYTATLKGGAPNEASVLVRMSWDGATEQVTEVPLLAHDFVELDDGTIVPLAPRANRSAEHGDSKVARSPHVWSPRALRPNLLRLLLSLLLCGHARARGEGSLQA